MVKKLLIKRDLGEYLLFEITNYTKNKKKLKYLKLLSGISEYKQNTESLIPKDRLQFIM